MIPTDHPRFGSLKTREHLARCAGRGIVSLEGLTAHGRGEAFDYLMGERTIPSAREAEKHAAALLLCADRPVLSINGNTAALAAPLIRDLQAASHALVEVNLFHRTPERMRNVTACLEQAGVEVLTGVPERLLPLSHDRGLCLREGIGAADVVLVPLEDGDRCQALVKAGKKVIVVDLNPLSRSARSATLAIVDELTRALPVVTSFCRQLGRGDAETLARGIDNSKYLSDALAEIRERLSHALD